MGMYLQETLQIVQPKFPEYCSQVTKMKGVLRSVARKVSQAVTLRGVAQFKQEIERILCDSKVFMEEHIEEEIHRAARDTFDRVSYDGNQLCSEEELENMVTGLEFKFSEFLVAATETHKVLIKSAVRQLPMSFDEFLNWFDANFRREAPQAPLAVAPEAPPLAVTSALGSFESIGQPEEPREEE